MSQYQKSCDINLGGQGISVCYSPDAKLLHPCIDTLTQNG